MSNNSAGNPQAPIFLSGEAPELWIPPERRFGEALDPHPRAALLTAHSGKAALLLMQTVTEGSPATAGKILTRFTERSTGEDSRATNQNTIRNWAEGYVGTGVFSVEKEKNRRLYRATTLARTLLPVVGFFHDFDSRHQEQGVSAQTIFGRPNGELSTDQTQLKRVWALRYIANRIQTGGDIVTSELATVLKIDRDRTDYAREYAKRLARAGLFELDEWSVSDETVFQVVHPGQRHHVIASAGETLRFVIDYTHNREEVSREELQEALIGEIPRFARLSLDKQRTSLANILSRLEGSGFIHKVHGRFTDGVMQVDASKDQRAALTELLNGLDSFAAKSHDFIETWGGRALELAHDSAALTHMFEGYERATNAHNSTENISQRVLGIVRAESNRGPIGAAEITRLITEEARSARAEGKHARVYDRQTIDAILRRLLSSGAVQAGTMNQGRVFTAIPQDTTT